MRNLMEKSIDRFTSRFISNEIVIDRGDFRREEEFEYILCDLGFSHRQIEKIDSLTLNVDGINDVVHDSSDLDELLDKVIVKCHMLIKDENHTARKEGKLDAPFKKADYENMLEDLLTDEYGKDWENDLEDRLGDNDLLKNNLRRLYKKNSSPLAISSTNEADFFVNYFAYEVVENLFELISNWED